MKKHAFLFLIVLMTCTNACHERIHEIANEVSHKNNKNFYRYAPERFRQLIESLAEENPEYGFHFQMIKDQSFFKVSNLINDSDNQKIFFHDLLTGEEQVNIHQRRLDGLKEYFDANSKKTPSSILQFSEQKIHGVIVGFTDNGQFNTYETRVHKNVDELPYPWDGFDRFNQQVADKIDWPDYFNSDFLSRDIIFETVVTQQGNFVYCNIIQGVDIADEDKMWQLNGLIFKAFKSTADQRGWRPGRLQGKRVHTRIKIEIPASDLLI